MIRRLLHLFIFIAAFFAGAIYSSAQTTDVERWNSAVRNITDVIVHDVITPPAASRIYAYSTIAGYEVLQLGSADYASFRGKLNGMPLIQEPTDEIDFTLAGVLAMYYTAQLFLPSYKLLYPVIDSTYNEYKLILPEKKLVASQLWGSMTAMKMMSWAGKDGFEEIHAMSRYELIDVPFAWQPTPPDYADPVEPYWGLIRPFLLDSLSMQLSFTPPVFSTDTTSSFYSEAIAVYEAVNHLTEEQKQIAKFWDDNPYTSNYVGHMQFATKKISPGGHWLDITRIAIEKSSCDLLKAAEAYACVSIAMADGFIICWKQKYEFNLLRPETYINRYIDPTWKPFLQTPPFPEYTSGHSVISTACAEVLTRLFGEDFGFDDLSETTYDMPPRHFKSFADAAFEASLSRFYSGIHFMPAVDDGRKTGKAVGEIVVAKLLH